jgi:hypothetical protein
LGLLGLRGTAPSNRHAILTRRIIASRLARKRSLWRRAIVASGAEQPTQSGPVQKRPPRPLDYCVPHVQRSEQPAVDAIAVMPFCGFLPSTTQRPYRRRKKQVVNVRFRNPMHTRIGYQTPIPRPIFYHFPLRQTPNAECHTITENHCLSTACLLLAQRKPSGATRSYAC